MSRFLRSLLCRMGVHRPRNWMWFDGWNDSVTYGRFWTCYCSRSYLFDPSSPSPAPASSSSTPFLDSLSRPAIERAARRGAGSPRAWAPASVEATSPSQKARDTESASAPSGASR